jgi:hypothetical protein
MLKLAQALTEIPMRKFPDTCYKICGHWGQWERPWILPKASPIMYQVELEAKHVGVFVEHDLVENGVPEEILNGK